MKLPVWQKNQFKVQIDLPNTYEKKFHRTCIKSAIWYGKKQLKERTTKKVWIKLKQKEDAQNFFFPQVLFFSIFTRYSNLNKSKKFQHFRN